MTTAKGEFELTGWDENPYLEIGEGRKLTRASVTQDFRGDVAGTGAVEWLMSYQPDGTARSQGHVRVRLHPAMTTTDGQAENLLGALGLAIADRMDDAIVARA